MDQPALSRALLRRRDAVTELIRSAPDPDQRVGDSRWSVRDVGAHLVVITESYVRYVGGDPTPAIDIADLETSNPAAVEALGERDVDVLMQRVTVAVDQFVDRTAALDPDEPAMWHGVDTTVGIAGGVLLGELVIHGQDVARTVGVPWPIDRDEAAMILEAAGQMSVRFVDPERATDAAFEVRVRKGPTFVLRFEGGSARASIGPARDVDCRVSADPVALLEVLYGRRSQWPAILQGRLVAFGRKPWLAFGLASRFSGF